MPSVHVHFWTPSNCPYGNVEAWDPDTDPVRFSDGFSHAFLELYVRFRVSGKPVTLGRSVPAASDLVVVFAKSVTRRSLPSLFASARRRPIVLIRSDKRLGWAPFTPEVEVMPSRATVSRDHQLFLPLLPQRGLVPRASERGVELETAVIKGNPENLPSFFSESWFIHEARKLGFTLRADTPGGGRQWHDFSDVDVALCIRDEDRRVWPRGDTAKPATRAINAWVGGAIPVVSPEPQYLELVEDRVDALVADGPQAVLKALRYMRESEENVRRLQENGRKRAEEFSTDSVLTQWWNLFERTARSESSAAGFATRLSQTVAYATGLSRGPRGRGRSLPGKSSGE